METNPLNVMARELVGDDKTPDLYFVCDHLGNCFFVTSKFELAYKAWLELPSQLPSSLENRTYGVICSTEYDDNGNHFTYDNSKPFLETPNAS